MELHVEEADVAWIKSIDFDDPTLGVRDDRLQCRVVALPELDWSLFVFLAPMQHGLWLLRVYHRFDESLREVFFVQRDGQYDDDRVQRFETFLRKHRIPKNSEAAYRCFGLYPRLWGDRFGPRRSSALIPHRLFSVAVPAARTDRLHDYFRQQAILFGDRSIVVADEDEVLFITEREVGTADSRLLLDLVSRMDDAGRAAVRDRLLGLLESDEKREEFARNLSPGMKVSGAFRAPDPRDTRADCEADCVEIARLRVQLMCKLKWPHALEYMRSTMADTPEGHFADLNPEIDATLATFPVVAADPLA